MNVARIMLVGFLALVLGVDLVNSACEQRLLQRGIDQVEREARYVVAHAAQEQAAFQGRLLDIVAERESAVVAATVGKHAEEQEFQAEGDPAPYTQQ